MQHSQPWLITRLLGLFTVSYTCIIKVAATCDKVDAPCSCLVAGHDVKEVVKTKFFLIVEWRLDERRGMVLVYTYEPLMKYADLYFTYAEISSLVFFLCFLTCTLPAVKTNYLKCEFFIMHKTAILTKAHACCNYTIYHNMYHIEEAVSW